MATEGASTSKSINDMLNDVRKAAAQVKDSKAKGADVSNAEARLLEAVNSLARERDALQTPEQPPAGTNAELSEDQLEWLQRVGRLVEREKRNTTEPRGQACSRMS
ncbi:hypothetical protein NCS55_00515000 [Fusarium keratoplasticum]|nr:hypothetical protein NCS55_00515000 [Fusarium keratoplasticum]